MSYIKIKNNGLLDVKALTLIGASTKTLDSSKIGMFGSGNKYALAYLLRNNYQFQIFSGLEEFSIHTVPMNFRNQKFDVLEINGQQTSITTEMGKDWKFWQALRELYCNALDEDDGVFDITDTIEPHPDETHIYIWYEREAVDFLNNFDNYFSINKTVLFENEYGKILTKSDNTLNIYRKGIRCYDTKSKSLYDYDFNNITINENRIVKYYWEIEEKLWKLLFQCDNEEVLKNVYMNLHTDCYEGKFSSASDLYTHNMSDAHKEIVSKLRFVPKEYAGMLNPEEQQQYNRIPLKVYDAIKPCLDNHNLANAFKVYSSGLYRDIEPDNLQNSVINTALDFFKSVNFHIPYVIKLAIFNDKTVMGLAEEEIIILSKLCLEKGLTYVTSAILEEYIHIKYGVQDCTREFQNALEVEFISFMKQRIL